MIDLHAFDLDAIPYADAKAVLAPDEHLRAARLLSGSVRRRFVAARAVLRHLLAARTGEDPLAVRISQDDDGKPYLNNRACAFNLSHSGAQALLAIGPPGMMIGIDIEHAAHLGEPELLIAQCLCESERDDWARLAGPEERRAAFLRLWVRKEACLKAIGKGLSIEPNRFSSGWSDATGPHPVRIGERRILVVDLECGEQARAALALADIDVMPAIGALRRVDLGLLT